MSSDISPLPFPGAVVHYGYLWHEQQRRGQVSPSEDRPCLIVLVRKEPMREAPDDGHRVWTMPITTRPDPDAPNRLELDRTIKDRLGLDPSRSSWLVCEELNVFVWRGPDLLDTPDGRSWYRAIGQRQLAKAVALFRASGPRRRVTFRPE